MKIGIIGAGFVGRAIARLAVKAECEAMVSNSRGVKSLASVSSGLGARVGTVAEAAAFGDLALLAIPFDQCLTIPAHILAGKLVVDANNYYPERDGSIPALDDREVTTSQLLAGHFRDSIIVKAFNAILAKDLETDGRPAGAADRRALPIAGDDQEAKDRVLRFVDRLGFDAVDAGSLEDSWRFERAKPAYCVKLDREKLVQALAAAERNVDMPDGSWRS